MKHPGTVVIPLLVCALLLAIRLGAQEQATQTPIEDVLALKAELQTVREQLLEKTRAAAQCDLDWANTRAQLASMQLLLTNNETKDGRAQLESQAKAAGLTITWPDEKNKLTAPAVKKLEP